MHVSILQSIIRSRVQRQSTSDAPQKSSQEIPALTGVRGVAALLVTFTHFSSSGHSLGQVSVQIFFVLSAFLMCLLYLDAPRGKTASERLRFSSFFIRNRLSRVVPLPLIMLAVCATIRKIPPISFMGVYPIKGTFAEYVTMRTASGIQWTIVIELVFYFFFAAVLTLTPRAARIAVWLAVGAAAAMFAWPSCPSLHHELGVQWGLVTEKAYTYKWFMVGALTYALHYALCVTSFREPELPQTSEGEKNDIGNVSNDDRPWSSVLFQLMASIFLVVSLIIRCKYWQRQSDTNNWDSICDAASLVLFVLGAVWLWPLRMLLSSAPLRYAGKVSYSIYLVHMPILQVFARYSMQGNDKLEYFLPFVAVVVAVATFSYYAIERTTHRALRSRYAQSMLPSWCYVPQMNVQTLLGALRTSLGVPTKTFVS